MTINQTKKANENLGFGFSVKEKLKLKTFQFIQFTVLSLYIVRNYKHKKHLNIRKYLFTVQMKYITYRGHCDMFLKLHFKGYGK